MKANLKVSSFDFSPGRILLKKYEVVSKIGEGWEGEVYLLREINTGIERAAKFFFPQRNLRNRSLKYYAKKLHKLRHCPIVIQYHTQETIQYRGISVTFLVSEFVEGERLKDFIQRQSGRRLQVFPALHLLHTMAAGMEHIHSLGEYHGDLHLENVMVRRYGLGFDLKIIDMYQWAHPKPQNIRDDICDMIRIFYDILGGSRTYASHPFEVKAICCGLKKSLILKKFRTAAELKEHLETLEWD